jgi:hypothetical protein
MENYDGIPFKNSAIKKLMPRREKVVEKYPNSKDIEITRYNPITGKGVTKQKQIEYKSDGSPKRVFKSKEVVRRDKDLNWKSLSESKKLFVGGKKVAAEKKYTTYNGSK